MLKNNEIGEAINNLADTMIGQIQKNCINGTPVSIPLLLRNVEECILQCTTCLMARNISKTQSSLIHTAAHAIVAAVMLQYTKTQSDA